MTFRKKYVRGVIFVSWIACMAWLVRHEAMPELFSGDAGGYASLFSRDVLIMDSWMKLIFQDKPIGFSHSSMALDEKNPKGRHIVQNRVHVRMNLLGSEQKVYVDTVVRLDDAYRLQSFSFVLSARNYRLELKGERRQGELFDIEMMTDQSTQTMEITIPDDVVIYSPMTEMAMKELKPGQSMQIKTLDPTSMSTATVTIKAIEKQTLEIGGTAYEAMMLSTDYRGMTITSWIDADGQLLRQETPFGWTMQKCSVDEAMATRSATGGMTDDMLAGMAVPCVGTIANPRSAAKLRLRLTGVEFGENDLKSERQTIEQRTADTVVMTVRSAVASGAPDADLPEDVMPFLEPSFMIQSDHEELRAQAAEIVAGCENEWDKAMALFDWVHKNVTKKMTVSVPSALDVLRTMRGDCNEHTYLYVGLARAAGLPAKAKVGLAYHEDAFYYHAWPAVYVGGGWFETEPTWGRKAVDATHLAIAEGELAEQMELVKVMGLLRIEVLEDAPDG